MGLVAGSGGLPIWVASALKAKGYRLAVLAIEGGVESSIQDAAEIYQGFTLDKGKEIYHFLKDHRIRHMVLAGKVSRKKIHQAQSQPDALSKDASFLRVSLLVAGRSKSPHLGPQRFEALQDTSREYRPLTDH